MSFIRPLCSRLRPAVAALRPLSSQLLQQASHRAPASLLARRGPATALLHTSSVRCNDFVINIQDEDDFQARVVDSKVPVIVDFHATWCGPCKLLGPRLETLVSAQNGDVIMAKVDIDELADIAMKHKVSAVPTVVAMKDGKVADMFVGLKDDSGLESFINKLTGK